MKCNRSATADTILAAAVRPQIEHPLVSAWADQCNSAVSHHVAIDACCHSKLIGIVIENLCLIVCRQ